MKRSNMIILAVLSALVLYILFTSKSGYVMSPLGIQTDGHSNPNGIFELPVDLKCAGGEAMGSSYMKGLTPGGVCGADEFVMEQMQYHITAYDNNLLE